MGYIIVIILMVGDLFLYCKGVRPEKSMWRDETIRWMTF